MYRREANQLISETAVAAAAADAESVELHDRFTFAYHAMVKQLVGVGPC